jgi:hypothetical protein
MMEAMIVTMTGVTALLMAVMVMAATVKVTVVIATIRKSDSSTPNNFVFAKFSFYRPDL